MPKKEKPLKKESLIIKFEHLNPVLQEIIGERVRIRDFYPLRPVLMGFNVAEVIAELRRGKNVSEVMASPGPHSIRKLRSLRTLYEGISLASLLYIVEGIRRKDKNMQKSFGGVLTFSATARTFIAKGIQWKHRGLVKVMKDSGILRTKFEKIYSKDWINPTVVARTHPTFYVNWKGDLIFPRMTRTEYARHVFQKRFPGKLGLNPWRWRAYLEPPKAPKKVKVWAAEKAAKWGAAMKRPKLKPALGFATARAKATRLEKARGKRRRRI